MFFRTCFIIAGLSAIFISCKKDNSTSEGHLLVKVIGRSGDSALYTFFNYDAQNRLIRIIDSNNSNHIRHITSVVYDANDKWIKSIYTNDFNALTGQDSFFYNNNQIVKKTYSNSLGIHNKNIYVYNLSGKLTHDTIYSYFSNNVFGFTNYTYDNNEDITSWQAYYDQGGTMHSDGQTSAFYNNLINPYSDLGMPFYILRNDNALISKHQITQEIYPDGSITNYTYEYYPGGLVKKITLANNSGGSIGTSTIEFFYD